MKVMMAVITTLTRQLDTAAMTTTSKVDCEPVDIDNCMYT